MSLFLCGERKRAGEWAAKTRGKRIAMVDNYVLMQKKIIMCFLFLLVFVATEVPSHSGDLVYGPYTVRFKSGSVDLEPESLRIFKSMTEQLLAVDIKNILVEGFCDDLPFTTNKGFKNNQELSKARAHHIAKLLSSATGLSSQLFTSIGHGPENPLSNNKTPGERAINRRVEVRGFGRAMVSPGENSASEKQEKNGRITLSFRDVPIEEAYEMLSKKNRINVVLEKGVTGKVSLNLYQVTLEEALNTVAASLGFALEKRKIGYVVSKKVAEPPVVVDETPLVMRTYEIHYFNLDKKFEDQLGKHLTGKGKVSVFPNRNILMVEDTEESVSKVGKLLLALDRQPQQILIEARILEISLDDSQSFGLDWSKIFSVNGGTGSVGVENLTTGTSGFVFALTNEDVDLFFNALHREGKVRTLSTPKLLTMENREASVIIGDRQGFKVTTTINTVTTESIQFLNSGVILNVTPSVDAEGRILMEISPEVSTGSIQDGIPSQATTRVTTVLQAKSGQPIFIGGLMKNRMTKTKSGVPLLKNIPVLGNLFSSTEEALVSTETVVIITPRIVQRDAARISSRIMKEIREAEELVQLRKAANEKEKE